MKQGMEFWMRHVAAAELDGGSVKAYAKRHGVSADALYYWRNKNKVKRKRPTDPSSIYS